MNTERELVDRELADTIQAVAEAAGELTSRAVGSSTRTDRSVVYTSDLIALREKQKAWTAASTQFARQPQAGPPRIRVDLDHEQAEGSCAFNAMHNVMAGWSAEAQNRPIYCVLIVWESPSIPGDPWIERFRVELPRNLMPILCVAFDAGRASR